MHIIHIYIYMYTHYIADIAAWMFSLHRPWAKSCEAVVLPTLHDADAATRLQVLVETDQNSKTQAVIRGWIFFKEFSMVSWIAREFLELFL